MRICIFTLMFLITACDSKEKSVSKEKPTKTDKTENLTFVQNDSLNSTTEDLKNMSQFLKGHWVCDAYLSKIEKTKSIYHSREHNCKILGFFLDDKALKSGSTSLNGYTEHEGGYSTNIVYDKELELFVNDMSNLPEYGFFQELFELEPVSDNKLKMNFPSSDSHENYRKVPDDISILLNDILIEGEYQNISDSSIVHFSRNGQLKGFKDFKRYEFVTDFIGMPDFDAIIFSNSSSKDNVVLPEGDLYKFEIIDNTIYLQLVNIDFNTMEYDLLNNNIVLEKLKNTF